MLSYRKRFNPDELRKTAPNFDGPRRPFVADYEYDDSIVLAVNVALATGRPLLLRGDAGSGKSTLAEDAARLLGWRYYEQVISSNIEAADLLYRIDQVSRIADAQAGERTTIHDPKRYLQPGVLFWAFAPHKAAGYGWRDPDRSTWTVAFPWETPAVVLLDEIDKAEPDFPNDLLVPLGALSFPVRALGLDVEIKVEGEIRPLVIVTTNEERDLPPAFLRRCIVLRLTVPGRDEVGLARLRAITRRHFSPEQLDNGMLETLMARYFELREAAGKQKFRQPGTAEFLDAARALVELRGTPGHREVADFIAGNTWEFRKLTEAALWKHRHPLTESQP